MDTDRRLHERRISPAIGENAINECARLRAENAALMEALKIIANYQSRGSVTAAQLVAIARAALRS